MWLIKIVAKLILSRLPLPYRFWSSLGVFRHGGMDRAKYALDIFAEHAGSAYPLGLPRGAVVLELGVGDSIASALIACAHGASRTYLIDVAPFARRELAFYRRLAEELAQRRLPVPDLRAARNLDDVLQRCRAEYLVDGLASLRRIPDSSVDFIWSQAVLEHVRRREFEATLAEMHRILKPGGRMSHTVDFKDHLNGRLNNLRFPERLWESHAFANSGFYTNRIRASQMLQLFRSAGYADVQVVRCWRFTQLPLRRGALHPAFRQLPDEDLLVSAIKVTMRRPQLEPGVSAAERVSALA